MHTPLSHVMRAVVCLNVKRQLMALTLGAESYKLCDVFRLCPTSRPETKDGSVSVEMREAVGPDV